MEKFLFYKNSAADMVCIPARRLTNILVYSNTRLHIRHRLPADDEVGSDARYEIIIDINAGTGEKISASISSAINSSKNPFIVIADDLNKVYIDENITNLIHPLPTIQ